MVANYRALNRVRSLQIFWHPITPRISGVAEGHVRLHALVIWQHRSSEMSDFGDGVSINHCKLNY